MLWALFSIIACAIVCGIFFIKGNMKVGRIIFAFYLATLMAVVAIATELYIVLLFSVPCVVMGIIFIVKDDETDVWTK